MTTHGSGDGAVFIQPDGLNTKPIFGGCVDIGELDAPKGDAALWQCRDPKIAGGFNTKRIVRGAPGLVTSSFTTDVYELATYFEELADNTPIYLCLFDDTAGGHKDVFGNATRIFVTKWLGTNQKFGNLAVHRADSEPDRGEFVVDVSGAPPLYAFFDLKTLGLRVSVSETEALNGLAFTDVTGDEGYAVCDADAAATPNVLRYARNKYDADQTVSWVAGATDPFAADEHAIGVVTVQIDKDTTRILTARGVTDGASPAEIAYSDDDGATWTNVDVGSTNGEFVSSTQALFALDKNNIWLGSDLGRIYHSDDGGETWGTQEDAVIHAADWLSIVFADSLYGMAGGESDVIAYTNDGGETWSAVTAAGGGNHINTVSYSEDYWWVGDAGGDAYFSPDNGTTWYQRGFQGDGSGEVKSIKFANPFFGVMVHNTAVPLGRILVTYDGGYSWTILTLPTNAGLNDCWIVGPRIIYAVGEVQGATGVLFKVESSLSNFA